MTLINIVPIQPFSSEEAMRDTSKRVGGRRNAAKTKKGTVGSTSRGKLIQAQGGRKGYLAGKCRNKES